ncbi:ABC transporter substrate-binding protein [Paenibacillus sp. LHD-117]|uniref:ABC transporter substrate-binding protein n=1 Tax=Paenibacillus sp. LHD-117 TaxID=3071412 RepID=UPI0027DED0CF|nr:ABC transporter substrate-binding protein [Paenibacillus sp. LHD-117]MDQ6419749.1 ABC transporter substrate-binding protein [Paenibacillus sp. LHD-117]
MKKLILFVVLSVVLIAGCSSKESDTEKSTRGETSTASYPISVEHEAGTTVIESERKRIVDIAFASDYLSALDVPMVGASAKDWGAGKIETVPYLNLEGVQPIEMIDNKANLEQVLALEPDLIIAYADQLDQYEQLSKIAPTIVLDMTKSDWRELFKTIAKTVQKEAHAERILEDLSDKIEEVKKKVDPQDAVFFHADFGLKQIALAGPLSSADALYQELQLPKSDIVPDGYAGMVEQEAFIIADPGTIFLYSATDPKKALDELKKDSLLSNLRAVKNDRVFLLQKAFWMNSGPISMDLRLEDLMNVYKPVS